MSYIYGMDNDTNNETKTEKENYMNTEKDFAKIDTLIENARKREDNDDHLETSERAELVALYKDLFPEVKLTNDLDADFTDIIYSN